MQTMRTKTLLLTAALSAAGMMCATAQTVFSVNAVGYVKKTVPPGEFALVANPLNVTAEGGNSLANVLPDVPLGTVVFEWNGAGFNEYTWTEIAGIGSFWGGDGADSATLNTGEGFYIRNNSDADLELVFVGEVPQGTLNVPLVSGFSLVSSPVPQRGLLETDLGLAPEVGDTVFEFTGTGFNEFVFEEIAGIGTFWSPEEPTIDVAQGIFYRTETARDWTRSFSVNE